jgi:uncharacterized membrane protein
MKKLFAIVVGIVTLFFGTSVAMSQPVHFNFRSFDLPGTSTAIGLGIDPQGDIVGGDQIGTVFHSYVLSNGTVKTVDPPYGIVGTSQGDGINPEGDIVGLYTDHGTIVGGDAFRTRAYLRDSAGNFTPIDFPGAENTFAIKISPTGQVVGCYHHQQSDFAVSGGGTMHGYVYQNGEYQSLPVPGTMNNGITNDGRIIVGVVFPTPSEFHAYRVEDGVYSLLDLPKYAVDSGAWDVNPSGAIVGFYLDSSNKVHGFLLNSAGFTSIEFPGAGVVFTEARGIDPEGNIVGFYGTLNALGLRVHGFIAAINGQGNSIILP